VQSIIITIRIAVNFATAGSAKASRTKGSSSSSVLSAVNFMLKPPRATGTSCQDPVVTCIVGQSCRVISKPSLVPVNGNEIFPNFWIRTTLSCPTASYAKPKAPTPGLPVKRVDLKVRGGILQFSIKLKPC
jgi:hypothetical protein